MNTRGFRRFRLKKPVFRATKLEENLKFIGLRYCIVIPGGVGDLQEWDTTHPTACAALRKRAQALLRQLDVWTNHSPNAAIE